MSATRLLTLEPGDPRAADADSFARTLDELRPERVELRDLLVAATVAREAWSRGIPCVAVLAHELALPPGSPFLDGRRTELVAALATYVEQLHVPSAASAGLASDLGLPAAMIVAGDGAAPPIALRWTGDHRSATSLATINRAVCAELAGRPGLALERREIDLERLDPALERPPAIEVRHRWPPDFTVPPVGRLALIQPWEFGVIPSAWEQPLRDGVDELWVPSEYVRRMYLDGGMPPERVHVVPNGVDLERFRPDGPRRAFDVPDGTRFLFLGGTIRRKGVDALVEAYGRAFAGRSDVTLVIKDVSPGNHYLGRNAGEWLRALADAGGTPRVLYLDQDLDTEELAALYRACDVLVHPYRGEGFAMPVLEAMACGLPVVVTAGGPTDEFVPDDACWRITSSRTYPPQSMLGDMPTSSPFWMLEPDAAHLARLLVEVDGDPAERERRGRAGLAAARRYTWGAVADGYDARIRALAARPPLAVARPLEPLDLPDARGRSVLATPAWHGEDRLGELLAAWAQAFAADEDVVLFLLADPGRDGDAALWEARVLAAADAAGVDLEHTADIALLEHRDAGELARVHAAVDAYVPLHDACGGHARLAAAAGAAVIVPTASALRALAPSASRAA